MKFSIEKFVPVIVTSVPPVGGPIFGVTESIVGGGSVKIIPLVNVPLNPSGLVTTISKIPTACTGVVTLIVLASILFTLVPAVPPNVIVGVPTKFAPLMVTEFPPVFGTLPGVTDETGRVTLHFYYDRENSWKYRIVYPVGKLKPSKPNKQFVTFGEIPPMGSSYEW